MTSNDTWVRVGVLINMTINDPAPRNLMPLFASLTEKEIAKASGIKDHGATHTE